MSSQMPSDYIIYALQRSIRGYKLGVKIRVRFGAIHIINALKGSVRGKREEYKRINYIYNNNCGVAYDSFLD